jgi:hypothetical protein
MKGNLGNVGYISKDMGKETKKKKSKDWLGMESEMGKRT